MALIIENGSIVTGAESYVSVTDADTYHLNRGNSIWKTSSVTAKEAALRKATSFVDNYYINRWKGMRTAISQPLQWPRQYVMQYEEYARAGYAQTPVYIESNVIPNELKYAICEAALRSLTTELLPDLDRGGKVKRVTIGPITEEYTDGAPATTTFTMIETLLSTLITAKNISTVVRA